MQEQDIDENVWFGRELELADSSFVQPESTPTIQISNATACLPAGLECRLNFLEEQEREAIRNEVLWNQTCVREGFDQRRRVWRFSLKKHDNKEAKDVPDLLLALVERIRNETHLEADYISVEEYPVTKWTPSGEYASHQTVTKFESVSVPQSVEGDSDQKDWFMAQIPLNKSAIQHINQPAKRLANAWELKSPNHQTDLNMPLGSLWIKTNECLFDWRHHIRTSQKHGSEPVLMIKIYKLPPQSDSNREFYDEDDTFGYRPSNTAEGVPENQQQAKKEMPSLKDLLTILITTSPVRSNPSTELIERIMDTFTYAGDEFAYQCRKVIVCDGFRLSDAPGTKGKPVTKRHSNVKQAMRNGIVTDDQAERYRQFKLALCELCSGESASRKFHNTVVEELEERQGYGFALKHALHHCVSTPYVCVIQHDRTFMRPTPVHNIVRCMWNHPNVKYVGLSMRSNLMYKDIFEGKYGYAEEFDSLIQRPPELLVDEKDYGPSSSCSDTMKECCNDKVWTSIKTVSNAYESSQQNLVQQEWLSENSGSIPDGQHQMSLTPTLFWYDNVHICETAHYRDFVFHSSYKMVARGGFVEDKLSPVMIRTVERLGLREGHSRFGCYLLDDHSSFFFTGHLDGGSFMTSSQKKAHFPASSS